MAETHLRAGFTGAPRDSEKLSEKAADAARSVKDQALAVRDAASEHPHSLTLALAVAGVAGYLIGHLAGFRSAERQLAPPPRRSLW